MWEETINNGEGEIKVSFGYQCSANGVEIPTGIKLRRTSSFACLSGAALSANATLANTNICNGLIASEILPTLDSPNSFRKVPSSPSLSKFDISSSSLQSCMSNLSCSPSTQTDPLEDDYRSVISVSAPSDSEGFLYSGEVQVAGGAAGEDRVQAVCSEENGWLFCAIYDGFNGRDAADFLAGTLYDTILYYFNFLDWEPKGSFQNITAASINQNFAEKVLDSLQCAVNKAENDFLCMVEQEMEDRPDLVSIGSCALVAILHGSYLYTLNLGDSRAILATYGDGVDVNDPVKLRAIQLTDSHTVDNEAERARILDDHPDDPMTVVAGKVKGKLKVTRAFGVGYLKKKNFNDAVMGILRVHNLASPPYVSIEPSLNAHEISNADHFVILASDGLFDFFSNDEAVNLVHLYISENPCGDPAKFLLEQLVLRAADNAGFSTEVLMSIPPGRRRKYHDDVTVIVVTLGTIQRTSKASTCM